MKEASGSKKVITAIVSAVIVLVLIIAGAIVVNSIMTKNRLNSELSIARQYLDDRDYDNAIAAFDRALEIDPKCDDAYLGKAEAYVGLGDYEKAVVILQTGFEYTQNPSLNSKIDEYEKEIARIEEEKRLEEERIKAEEEERARQEAEKQAKEAERQAKKQAQLDFEEYLSQLEIGGIDLESLHQMTFDEWIKFVRQIAGKYKVVIEDNSDWDGEDKGKYIMIRTRGSGNPNYWSIEFEEALMLTFHGSDYPEEITIYNYYDSPDLYKDFTKIPDYFPTLGCDLTLDEITEWADNNNLSFTNDTDWGEYYVTFDCDKYSLNYYKYDDDEWSDYIRMKIRFKEDPITE